MINTSAMARSLANSRWTVECEANDLGRKILAVIQLNWSGICIQSVDIHRFADNLYDFRPKVHTGAGP